MAEDVQLQRLCKVQEFRDLNNKLINYVLSMNVLLLWFEIHVLLGSPNHFVDVSIE